MNDQFSDMPSPKLEEAFELHLAFHPPLEVGRLATGGQRTIRLIGSGTVKGEQLRGVVVSGSETMLTRLDQVTTAEVAYLLQADDGTIVRVSGTGCSSTRNDFTGIRLALTCEVAESSEHAWLATRAFVAERADGSDRTLVMQIV